MATSPTDNLLTGDNTEKTITIRKATEADIPAVAALIHPYVEDGLLLARTLDEFGELMPGFFVAVNGDGVIVGCAALEIYSRKLAEIRSLAVSELAQGQGVGRLLVDACLERAREFEVFEVMAITTRDGFFQNCGFDYTLPGAKRALFYQTREQFAKK